MKLNQFKIKLALPVLFAIMSSSLQASTLDEFYQYFKSGQYPKALKALESIKVDSSNQSTKAYLTGLSYSRMQEYDKAIVQYEKAISEKNDSADLYYEYGQALYAANELKKSRESFKRSVEKKFNVPASNYYVAHISQLLEEYEMAKTYYTLVIKDKNSDARIKQVSYFQLAETMLSMAREKSSNHEELTRRVDKFILPMMALGLKNDKDSDLAKEIMQRSGEIMIEFELDPDILANGRRINPKKYSGYAAQRIKYDNNVTLTNEENNIQESKKKSLIFETEGYARYDYVAKKRFVISPEARFIFTEHANQRDSEVYQNDSFVMNFSLKNKYEHKLRELPASTLFDIDYSRTLKDWKAEKSREFYASAVTFTLGETFSYFSFGETTLKMKRKNYTGEEESISNHTTTIGADQIIFLPIQHLILATFDASFIDNYNNTSTSTNTYTLRVDYIIPDIQPKFTLDVALAIGMTDTKEQKSTRGTEMLYNPSFDFSYVINTKSTLSFNVDYTKSSSKDESYAYSKEVITTEYRYAF
jgi:tetratricopeptide (TPR) repeat protein